ncbi:MAG: insulinase family protein, partial [Chloroflexota bacterium]
YPKGDVRYVESPDESIESVKAATLDEVKKFYADFYGADHGEVSVIGDFDEKEVTKLVGDLFGGWKSKTPYARVPTNYREVEPINKAFETPDKANALFIAGMNLNLRDDDPDYPALVLGNYMLGGGFLNSRLAVRIRQQ